MMNAQTHAQRVRCTALQWCLFLLAFCTSASHAAIGAWSTAGPEGVQGVDMAVSAAAPDTILVVSNGTVFRSINAGTSWSRLTANIGYVSSIWMHPTLSTNYLAVAGGRLQRSTNSGASWSAIGTGLPAVTTDPLNAISVDPSNPNIVYAITFAALFRSTNGGSNFSPVTISGLATDTRFSYISVDPFVSTRIILALCSESPTQSVFYRSTDNGATFTAAAGALGSAGCAFNKFVFSGSTAGLIFSDYFKSTDGGANWAQNTAAFFPKAARNTTAELYSSDATGLILSTDGGVTWGPVNSGGLDNGTNFTSVSTIAFKPGASPTITYVLSAAGSFFKATGGGALVASNTGLISSNIRAVAVHPNDSNVLLAGWGDVGQLTSPAMFRSTNKGVTWARSNSGLLLDEIRDIEIDRNAAATPGTTVVYAVGWDRAPSQVSTAYVPSIAKSTDGGQTWTHPSTASFTGIGTIGAVGMGRARNIAIDLSSRIGGTGPSQKIYFTARGRVTCPTTGAGIVAQTLASARMYKTTDAGATWTSIDSFPTGTCTPGVDFGSSPVPKDVVIDPSNPNTLYVGSFLSLGYDPAAVPPQPIPTVNNGVFKSTDGGASWALSSNGLPRVAGAGSSYRDVLALVIDPVNPQILYAAVNPTSGTGPGRVYKTTDGGANWAIASTGISGQDVRALLIDPLDRTKIYAASGGNNAGPGGVYFSANSGVTWNSTSIALPASSATALDIDRTGADPILYAGTNVGLWDITQVADLDADGPSNLLEGTAPFSGDGNEDGQPDANQGNVASTNGISAPINGAERSISANAEVTISITGIPAGSCQQVNDAYADFAEKIGPENAGYSYPFGVIRFELLNCTRAFVNVRYHNQSFNPLFRFRNFGPEVVGNPNTVAWREVVSAGYTGNTWTFLVEDNTPGDNRDEASRILFIGGPATEQLLKDGFE